MSFLKGIDKECVKMCIKKSLGFSSTCSPAFGELADCAFKNCKAACITGDLTVEACVVCFEASCSPAFHAETGWWLPLKRVDCSGWDAPTSTAPWQTHKDPPLCFCF